MSCYHHGPRSLPPVDMPAPLPPVSVASRLLTLHDLCAILQISKMAAERLIRSEPRVPQPRTLRHSRLIRFLAEDVQTSLEALPFAEYDDPAFDPRDKVEGV